jgi:hypothetical protein
VVLYLLALAWIYTTRGTQDGTNDADTFLAGTDITNFRREYAPQFTEAYLSSFYRICIFISLLSPCVFAAPCLRLWKILACRSSITIDMEPIRIYSGNVALSNLLGNRRKHTLPGILRVDVCSAHLISELFQVEGWPNIFSDEQQRTLVYSSSRKCITN